MMPQNTLFYPQLITGELSLMQEETILMEHSFKTFILNSENMKFADFCME